jgi:chromosome segregation ATPase
MADDRQLRDELERVQGEVARLRRALAQPDSLHGDVRARIETLRRSKVTQAERLDEAQAELDRLEAEVRAVMTENAKRQLELDGLLVTERTLIGQTVHHLNPGAPPNSGCLTALALAALVLAAGACW